jgi:hypothetical protein
MKLFTLSLAKNSFPVLHPMIAEVIFCTVLYTLLIFKNRINAQTLKG